MGFAHRAPTPVYKEIAVRIDWGGSVTGRLGRERAKYMELGKPFGHEGIQIPEWPHAACQRRYRRDSVGQPAGGHILTELTRNQIP
jgi:hypothetical protein